MAHAESSTAPLKRQLSIDDDETRDPGPSARTLEIKRRLVRAKKLRRPGDLLDDEPEEKPPSPPPQPAEPPDQASSSRPDEPAKTVSPPRQRSNSPRAPSPPPPPRGIPRSDYAPPRSAHPGLVGCRSVYSYSRLNHIEEGTYGVVFRARCNDTGKIYALKKLKLDEEKHGFPITSLREIMALMTAGEHENVVGIREIVVGDTLNQCVYAAYRR